jgi:hypothetical protein
MDIKTISEIIGSIGTFLAVSSAAWIYYRNSRLERAKWQAHLYEKFYEKPDLKRVREILDSDDEISLEITKLIRDESPEFTDYLNFFEFVAFLKKSKQLKIDEVDDLFGYYLDCLNRRSDIQVYVSKRGYELLSELLAELKKEHK